MCLKIGASPFLSSNTSLCNFRKYYIFFYILLTVHLVTISC
jgi:hypothetical protein